MADLPKNQTGDAQAVDPADPTENPTDSVEENIEQAEIEPAPETEGENIKDTLEVLDAVDASYAAVNELVDGNYIRGARQIFETLDDYRDAFEGVETVPSELSDLDEDELERLAHKALSIANQFV